MTEEKSKSVEEMFKSKKIKSILTDKIEHAVGEAMCEGMGLVELVGILEVIKLSAFNFIIAEAERKGIKK